MWGGGRFSKVPITIRARKAFFMYAVYAVKIKVSIILKIIQ